MKIHYEMVEYLDQKLTSLSKIFLDLLQDKNLVKILQYVLAIGNYLNGTSARGGAFGFKFDAINKLSDVKMMSS